MNSAILKCWVIVKDESIYGEIEDGRLARLMMSEEWNRQVIKVEYSETAYASIYFDEVGDDHVLI
jgi:hypothetical protein